jgi:hypothetical protein
VDHLAPLLDRLAAYRPTRIAIEALSAETLSTLETYEATYPGVAEMFSGRVRNFESEARQLTTLTRPQAQAEARDQLAKLPAAPAASHRRRLAALFAAAGDPHSALVQWLRLPPAERVPGDGVGPGLAGALDRLVQSSDERVSIAVRLAARLGHERVFPMDDQTETDLAMSRLEAIGQAQSHPAFQAFRKMTRQRRAPDDASWDSAAGVLRIYRRLNGPEEVRAAGGGEWGAYLAVDKPAGVGRTRVAQWEVRNLRMVANIREATAEDPGGRMLVVVGADHKPHLDAYLSLMSDVELDRADVILR